MVSDRDSFLTARRITREEGILAGGSCGTAVWAALELGRELGPDDVVVVLLPDSGRGYLSKIYNDEWMSDHGFIRAGGETVAEVMGRKTRDLPPLVHVHPDEIGALGDRPPEGVRRLPDARGQGRAAPGPGRGRRLGERPLAPRSGLPRPLDRGPAPRRRDGGAAADDGHGRDGGRGRGPACSTAARWSCSTTVTPSASSPDPICWSSWSSARPTSSPRERGEGLRDPGHPRRPGPRSGHRRGRARRSTRPPPSPRTRSVSTGATSTAAAATRPGPPSRHCLAALEGAAHGVAFASGLAGVRRRPAPPASRRSPPPARRRLRGDLSAWSPRSMRPGRARLRSRRHGGPGRPGRGVAARDPPGVGRDALPIRCSPSSISPRWPTSPTAGAPWSWSTTPSPRPTCSTRSPSAPTSWSTRPPSTSAVTATWSAAFVATGDEALADRLAFLQNAAGGVPGPVRLLPHPAGNQDPGRAHGPALRQRRGRGGGAGGPPGGGAGSTTRACRRIRGHEVAARQMRAFGGMVSFTVAGGEQAALEVARSHRAVHAGRVARGGRVAHRAPAPHDPRLGRRHRRWRWIPPCCGSPSVWRRPTTWWPTWLTPSTGLGDQASWW